MHYFITGTAGFIGFDLARRQLADRRQLTGFPLSRTGGSLREASAIPHTRRSAKHRP